MNIPIVRGTIDRRILVNYRADPAVVVRFLPAPFRPKLAGGRSIVGICLIRLRGIRPVGLPACLGIGSENAAHRIAVEWNDADGAHEGVYIPRRDTNSWLNAAAGGRLFPGVHHHARFDIRETADEYRVSLRSDDGETTVSLAGRLADRLPTTSIFHSLAECVAFFQAGCAGYSPTGKAARLQGLELRCHLGNAAPLAVDQAQSSYFEDAARFLPGSVEFDSALVMRNLPHEWRRLPELPLPPGLDAPA
jgi:hypothetical protein